VLKAFLTKLSLDNDGQGTSLEDQLYYLKQDLGLDIASVFSLLSNLDTILIVPRRPTLIRERKRLGIPSLRRNKHTLQDQLRAFAEVTNTDRASDWGVHQVRSRLASKGVLSTRYDHVHFESNLRPGKLTRLQTDPTKLCHGP
jgi:hypothetical protein